MTEFLGDKYPIHSTADLVYELLCSQICGDYNSIIRNEILPDMSPDLEIGVREIRVMLTIDSNDGLASSAFIADTLRYDPGTVTRASKRLVRAKYITRKKKPNDRRTLYFELTSLGQELAETYRCHIRDHYIKLESAAGMFLSQQERMAILDALTKLRARSEALAVTDHNMRKKTS